MDAPYGGRHPLYLFTGDTQPGDANGQAVAPFGAARFAPSATGSQAPGSVTSSGGGNDRY